MLTRVTFTGVDSKTSPVGLLELSKKYPFAEFGVLMSSNTGKLIPIYPPVSFINEFKEFAQRHDIKIALHLCGKYAKTALDKDHFESIDKLCRGFDRVQLNLPRKTRFDKGFEIERFVRMASVHHVILQHQGTWNTTPLTAIDNKLEYLHDKSGGRGEFTWTRMWPPPHPRLFTRYGYAGGIGPDTIQEVLDNFISRYPKQDMWLDMEGRIRTNGLFDLNKVRQVLECVWGKKHEG